MYRRRHTQSAAQPTLRNSPSSCSPEVLHTLERVLQRKFDLPVVCGGAGDCSAPGYIRVRPGQSKGRMIENVEKLSAKLDLLRFVNLEVLLENDIEGDQVWPAQIPDRRIAPRSGECLPRCQRRNRKCRLVVPALDRVFAGIHHLLHL